LATSRRYDSDIASPSSPSRPRRRTTRLVILLAVAVILASALVYTSFSAAEEVVSPSQLRAVADDRSYQLTGVVVDGSIRRRGDRLRFRVRDRTGTASVPVTYTGAVPDPFRAGREVIVTVQRRGAGYAAEPDSLITKCPSKFEAEETR
jgi:cytochrome c-type biogenesis protein CcmE